jgi:autotransporter family porin
LNAVLVTNQGYFEVEAGGQLSADNAVLPGLSTALSISGGSTAVNNGVISGAISDSGEDSTFTNNGILNVQRGITGLTVSAGATASNTATGIINVGTTNAGAAVNGVVVNHVDSSFDNDGLIYIGRAAQFDVANPEAVPDTTSGNLQRIGIFVSAGTATNNQDIVIGTGMSNATAMALTGAAADSGITNTTTGIISITGAVSGQLQNFGMVATTTAGTVLNEGLIELTGTNAVAMKAISTTTLTTVTHTGTIDVAGGFDALRLRNYGIWAEGPAAQAILEAGGDGDGAVNLTGDGGIGVHARSGATVHLAAGSGGVNFVSGSNQIGFFTFGTGSTIINDTGMPLEVSTQDSTLFRVENGASYLGVQEIMTASGDGSTLITGSGTGAVVDTNGITFMLFGDGARGLTIDGGAVGTIEAFTTINLLGDGAIAGVVDGRKIGLTGAPAGSFASILNNEADIESSATNGVGFITQYGGTLNNDGIINLDGIFNIGIIARSGGILNNTADVTVANGIGLLVEGAGSASQLSNSATITANDGIAAIEVIDGAKLTGNPSIGFIVADGTAHGVLIAAAGPDPKDPANNLTAGAGASLGANTITVKGTGNGVENAAETSDINFVDTIINVKNGAGIRTATSISPTATVTVNVSGSGEGFRFQQADGSTATGDLTIGPGYTIEVDGSSGTHGGVGILADTSGTVATAATVHVTDAQGGSALLFGDEVDTGSNSGTLTSISTVAPTVDTANATSFTNTGTIANTGAGNHAVTMRADDATFNNTGTVTGNVDMNGANATVNIGDAATNAAGIVTGTIQLTSGTNEVLITAGSSVGIVAGSTGTDTTTIQGQGSTFNQLIGTTTGTQTAVFDDNDYTLAVTSAITNYNQVNLINNSTLTLQTVLGGTPAGGAAIDVEEGSTLAVAPSPLAAYTLANKLTGEGLVTVDTGVGNAFNFAATTGDAFTGTVRMGPSTFLLGGNNALALTNATLVVATDNVTTVGVGPQTIGNLTFDGGTMIFDATIPPNSVASNLLTVTDLDVSGTGFVGITVADPYLLVVPTVAPDLSLFAQSHNNTGVQLVKATGTVTGSAAGLTMVDQNGDVVSDTQDIDIQQNGNLVAIGTYDFGFNTGAVNDGLYATYQLTQVDLLPNRTLTLTEAPGATFNDYDLAAKIIGTGNLNIAANTIVSLSNPGNTFTGATTITSGTLQANAVNIIGFSSSLTMSAATTFDTNGFNQHVNNLNSAAANSSVLLSNNDVLTLDGTANSTQPNNTNTFAGVISGAGSVVQSSGTEILTGANTYTGGTTIANGATVQLGNGGTTGSITGNVVDNGTLAFNRSNAYAFNGNITGIGGVNQNGTGTTTLFGTNTYSGPTNVNAGTLAAGAVNRFSANSATTVATNGTLDLNGFNQTVASLSNNGIVRFNSTGTDATFAPTILTVTGNYTGNNGVLQMSTVLGDDNSPSDKMVVTGNVSGNTTVQVTNAGGLGAPTTGNGILLVQVGGTSTDDAFALAGDRVLAGQFAYGLEFRDIAGAGNNWYLRTMGDRPEVPEVIIISSLARRGDLDILANLHKRRGDDLREMAESDLHYTGHVWGRLMASKVQQTINDSDDTPSASGNSYGAQLGLDLLESNNSDGRTNVGVYVGWARSKTDIDGITSNPDETSYVGRVSLDTTAFGVYWTYKNPNGFYSDVVVQQSWYGGDALSVIDTYNSLSGRGAAASLEAGYSFQMDNGWTVEPQAQFIVQGGHLDPMELPGAVPTIVSHDDPLQKIARLGVRVAKDVRFADGSAMKPYARFNVWHGFDATQTTTFTTPQISTQKTTGLGYTSGEVAGGVTWALTDKVSLHGELGYLFSLDNNAQQIRKGATGTIGLRWGL